MNEVNVITAQTLQITFRGMQRSAALTADIEAYASKLEHVCPELLRFNVLVEAPHHHHHQGRLYHVRIVIQIPGKDIVASHERHDAHAHENPHVAVRDAFAAAERQLLKDIEHLHRANRESA
jgi:ribosome-associated translation inhibitor RaiA